MRLLLRRDFRNTDRVPATLIEVYRGHS